ncbi:hypothetical protein ACFL5V_01185 [Fibrobacterota bacterium]
MDCSKFPLFPPVGGIHEFHLREGGGHALLLSLIMVFCLGSDIYAKETRAFKATPGAVRAETLPEDFSTRVDSIAFRIFDAFDGSRVNTSVEEEIFKLGNLLHIESSQVTVRRRLLFEKGDVINKELLMETERLLRKEEFLAEAILEVLQNKQGGAGIIVNTFDQFSTIPAWGFGKPAEEWEYWFGLVESNLVGTGQKIGMFYSHDIDRNTYWGLYENKAFLFKNLHLSGLLGRSSDGYKYNYTFARPLVSKKQEWGYSVSGESKKATQFYYLDADVPGEARRRADNPVQVTSMLVTQEVPASGKLYEYRDVVDHNFSGSITRSFGIKHKFNLMSSFVWNEKYQSGDPDGYYALSTLYDSTEYDLGYLPPKYQLDFRRDFLLGLSLSYFQVNYKTVKNFRNLKWSEDIEVGFRITNSISRNMKALGAKNSDLYFTHTLVYKDVWTSAHFLSTSLSSNYFLDYSGNFEDGSITHVAEYQMKPMPVTSTYFSSNWTSYFAREPSSQLLLGGEEGLSAYPNRFFAGQARLFMQLEQRYFPNLEFATGVPAFAAFLNAGDAFSSYRQFEWNSLHYSAGVGVRIGATRSVQKIVNHLNFSFPLDPKYRDILSSWRFTVTAKANL